MPAVIPFIPLIAAGIAGTGAVVASKISADSQKNSANRAIDFQTQQENERRREWDIQTAAAKKAWDTNQANLAPYRAARLQVLRKRGFDVPDVAPVPPDYSAGPPPGWKPGDPLPGAASSSAAPKPRSNGSSWALPALGAIGGVAAALPGLWNKSDNSQAGSPDLPTPDQYNRLANLGGPTSGVVPTSNLSNWSDWSNYYGVPGQDYQGE